MSHGALGLLKMVSEVPVTVSFRVTQEPLSLAVSREGAPQGTGMWVVTLGSGSQQVVTLLPADMWKDLEILLVSTAWDESWGWQLALGG